MYVMRRWREYGTEVVHGFSLILFSMTFPRSEKPIKTFCGTAIWLWRNSARHFLHEIPPRRNPTYELPSVKTPLTCIGCIALAR